MVRKKVLVAFGTRPEAVKMCPLILLLKKCDAFQTTVCVTGQHRALLDQVLTYFNVVPDYDLAIMRDSQTLFHVTTGTLNGIRSILESEKPNVVLVHGDTATSFSVALAAFYMGIPVGHVEAGLRTYDVRSPFPEEFFRQAVDAAASYLFAPTEHARDALIREGKDRNRIYVTGNTVVDAIAYTVREDYRDDRLSWAADSRLLLLTAHRRENVGKLCRMFAAIRRVIDEVPDVKLIFPMHPSPLVREAAACLANHPRIRLIEPLGVFDFHNHLARAHLILTDSGGIQEEATALGKPVLVLRDTTERPEGVEAGSLKLVGVDEEAIYEQTLRALLDTPADDRMRCAYNPYGDGHASERIVSLLETNL